MSLLVVGSARLLAPPTPGPTPCTCRCRAISSSSVICARRTIASSSSLMTIILAVAPPTNASPRCSSPSSPFSHLLSSSVRKESEPGEAASDGSVDTVGPWASG